MTSFIRTSQHSLKATNKCKGQELNKFIYAYREAVKFYVGFLWNNKIKFHNTVLDVKEHQYDVPKFIAKVSEDFDTVLTARALKCASTQACGIVAAVLDKRQKDENKLEWLYSQHKKPSAALLERLEKPPACPSTQNINCELNSIIVSVGTEANSFDIWLNFLALFKDKRGFKLAVPARHHRQSRKWQSKGKLLTSILLNEHQFNLRWEVEEPKKRTSGSTIGVDQGITDLLTISNNQEFLLDAHGHTLTSILHKIARKHKGSLAFAAAQQHRKNYINWYIKKLDLANVKEVKLEKITNIGYRRTSSRFLRGFTNTLIRDSVERLCLENGVRFSLIDNEYNSQRCNQCGWTQKSNRKGKLFLCRNCKHEADADANASCNILIRDSLFLLPFGFRAKKLNIDGFFWTQEHVALKHGEELTVLLNRKI